MCLFPYFPHPSKTGMQVAYGKKSVTNKAVRTKFLSDRHATFGRKGVWRWWSHGRFMRRMDVSGRFCFDLRGLGSGSILTYVDISHFNVYFSRFYPHCRCGSTPSWFHVWDSWLAGKSPEVLSLQWAGVWFGLSASCREDLCIMLFLEHLTPGVHVTQFAKARLRLFSASKDALRIWSVKSATVSRKSQWCYFSASSHLSLGLELSTIFWLMFYFDECVFSNPFFGEIPAGISWHFFGRDETTSRTTSRSLREWMCQLTQTNSELSWIV